MSSTSVTDTLNRIQYAHPSTQNKTPSPHHQRVIENQTAAVRTPMGATVLTVPEPQQLSPLLQTISPPFAISSLPNVVRSPTSLPYTPSTSLYPPNTPSTPRTPATPISDSASNKSDAPDSGTKEKKPKKPKLTKQEREQNKLMREQKKKIQDKKEQQWKILQQQRIFEQQRQAILNQSKAMALDATMHPSQRFNATMNSKLADDALQHTLMMKNKATTNKPNDPFGFGQASTVSSATTVTTVNSMINTPPTSSHQFSHDALSMATASDTLFSPQQGTLTTVPRSVPGQAKTSSTPTRPGSTPTHQQQPPQSHVQLPQSPHPFAGKPPSMYELAGSSRIPGQEGFPDDLANMDPLQMRSSEQQQKAFLFQQQYMASQQQYIQWQLAQQAAVGNMYMQQGSKPKTNTDSKDLQGSEGDEHERMQMFLNHRQMHNESTSHFMKLPIDKPGSDKRAHPDLGINQPFPAFQDGRLNGSMMMGGSRVPPLPPNTPQEAVYQKMLMELIMRYREIVPTAPAQIPPNQLQQMMAEVARACYRNQLEKSFQQPSHPQHPSSRDPHIDPGLHHHSDPHPPGWPPGVPFDWGRVPPPESARSRLIRPPRAPVPTSTFSPPKTEQDIKPPPSSSSSSSSSTSSSSQMKGLHGGLPKSASFQISRIAADSTSNDDFPNTSIESKSTLKYF